ncbi:hypothetical protein [Mesorhizobium sp. B2-3-4]|uniref:hypothetical protein n=1 Tax=Mesorhizobium sp. B2-3-4 TaxID=2589959 RepID=UPI00112DB4D5|nr:hypothetical protein [Mesorhizobium sp. B2-3-4]TPM38152.1 hypothetical protein FJ967_12850 [Mesorhizobium sp. B2-3-4]
MNKFIVIFAAVAVASSVGAAEAGCGSGGSGGWGGGSSSLINISPSIDLGKVDVLNGVLNGNNVLSGNLVSGILSGNKTGLVGGVLSGIGINLAGGNDYRIGKRH